MNEVTIRRTCRECHTDYALRVTTAALARWADGRGNHVQDAFPMLTADERELILTGICGACFDTMALPNGRDAALTEPGHDEKWAAIEAEFADETDLVTPAVGGVIKDKGVLGAELPGVAIAMPATGMGHVTAGREILANLALVGSHLRADVGVQAEPWRGHVNVVPYWPRCVALTGPQVATPFGIIEPTVCHRPGTIIARFTHEFLDSIADHRCPDPDCLIMAVHELGSLAELAAQRMTVCGLHAVAMWNDHRTFERVVGCAPFAHDVIGIELVHDDESAEVIDLRVGS